MSSEKKISKREPKPISTVFTGAIIGFLAAAVLYSKNFPSWVPLIFSSYPIVFFGMFIAVCGLLGYVYALAEQEELKLNLK